MTEVAIADRTKFLGGSDTAAILGISPWKTPLEVFLDKIQPRVEVDPAKQKIFQRGKRMEPYVIDMLAEETGLEIIGRNNRYIDTELPFLAAEIDAEAASGENIEIKTVSPFKAQEWGEEQTDEVPVHYTAQAMHGLMVTGKAVCIFGVLIGADDFRVYRVERDDETIAAIREKEIEFWERIKTRTPPPMTSVSDVLLMFGKDSGSSIEADGKTIEQYNMLRDLKYRAKEIGVQIEEVESAIKMYMQDNAALTIDGNPIATWKTQNPKRFNQGKFARAFPDLFEQFKEESPCRIFRIK